ncbi:MAG: hypothetical protein LRY71_17710 [Bacillaceae bacterium]|nr:hypothetical protein [Bacillaceae bacterium]
MKRKKGTAEEIMMNFFPEILAASIQEEERPEQERQKVMTEYFSTFYVKDTEAVKQFLSQRSDMNQDNHLYSWSGNWVAYRDSELDKEVGIGEVFGSISLKGNELSFNTLNEEKLSEFQQLLQTNVEVESVKTEEKHLTIPYYAEVSNMILSMDHTVPKYFSLYAQHRNMLNIDAAIPAYDNLSLRQLVDGGRQKDADTWLKQSEYDLYRHVLQQFGSVEVTADFNTVRKQLNLPLSAFVTGGPQRSTQLVGAIKGEDIKLLGELGFDSVDYFFTVDFLHFYKQKTTEKSDATVRKYRNSLYDLRELLAMSKKKSWNDLNKKDWKKLISINYFALFESTSKTQLKDFLSIVKAFTKMIDERYGTNISNDVAAIAKETEQERL